MSPETRDFLDSVREAEDPAPGDESRVLASVHAALALGAVAGASVGVTKAAKLFGLSGFSALKLGGWVLALGAGVSLGASVWQASSARPSVDTALQGPAPMNHGVVPTRLPAPSSAPVTNPPATSGSDAPVIPPDRASIVSAPGEAGVRAEARKTASLRVEIALLASVRAALERGDGVGALRRLDEHVTDDRQFAAERRAARILALCSLGRNGEARAAATAFSRDFPRSVQRTAVERSCAAEKTTSDR